METDLFDYNLPQENIAQTPVFPRDHSRLMVLDRSNQTITHSHFYDLINFLKSDDILVFNETKVIHARLFGKKANGGKVEVLLLRKNTDEAWECLTKPGLKSSAIISFDQGLVGSVSQVNPDGNRILEFNQKGLFFDKIIQSIGIMPTPPYIKTKLKNPAWYQTIYAKTEGSAAAPTAGFHFTEKLFRELDKIGIQKEFVTLHVGLDTFRPVRSDKLEDHEIHSEWCEIDDKTAARLNEYKNEGRRIIAVGTTTVRTLESAALSKSTNVISSAVERSLSELKRDSSTPVGMTDQIIPFSGNTRLFIYPPYEFKFVDAMITNFHLPKSTLLALVSAFAGRKFILQAYEEAVRNNYRFFSFGDGMLIL